MNMIFYIRRYSPSRSHRWLVLYKRINKVWVRTRLRISRYWKCRTSCLRMYVRMRELHKRGKRKKAMGMLRLRPTSRLRKCYWLLNCWISIRRIRISSIETYKHKKGKANWSSRRTPKLMASPRYHRAIQPNSSIQASLKKSDIVKLPKSERKENRSKSSKKNTRKRTRKSKESKKYERIPGHALMQWKASRNSSKIQTSQWSWIQVTPQMASRHFWLQILKITIKTKLTRMMISLSCLLLILISRLGFREYVRLRIASRSRLSSTKKRYARCSVRLKSTSRRSRSSNWLRYRSKTNSKWRKSCRTRSTKCSLKCKSQRNRCETLSLTNSLSFSIL